MPLAAADAEHALRRRLRYLRFDRVELAGFARLERSANAAG